MPVFAPNLYRVAILKTSGLHHRNQLVEFEGPDMQSLELVVLAPGATIPNTRIGEFRRIDCSSELNCPQGVVIEELDQ